jgi:histidyl-tRNA synthetase
VAKRFGFREIATPIFENSELFTIKSGPNIVDEIYAFQDKGGREIALRPELTAPVIRMFVNELSNEPRPLKLFYFGQCFRYERPQSGRYREFFQFGAELIGNANPESDAEMVALAHSMIESLGLSDYCIRIGHIGVLRQSLREAGVRDDDLPTVLQKLDKKNYEESRPLLQACGVSEEDIQRIEVLTETVGGPEVLEHLQNEAGVPGCTGCKGRLFRPGRGPWPGLLHRHGLRGGGSSPGSGEANLRRRLVFVVRALRRRESVLHRLRDRI